MCGIYSFLNHRSQDSNLSLVEYFKNGASRGPDNSTFINLVEQLNLHIGFHRLSINGIDKGSDQPLFINNNILICNGEIYNYKQLIEKYDIKTKTNSDCEIIIHMYEKFGFEKMIQIIDGVFAFILIDCSICEEPKLFVSRDSYGVRPLYIAHRESTNSTIFSSTLSQVSPHFTVKQFTPGTWSQYSLNKVWSHVSSNTFFNVYSIQSSNNNYDFIKNNASITAMTTMYKDIIYYNLSNAVQKRVDNTDRPIACLLSGGLDSSLITSLVCNYYQTETRKLETYSIGMQGSEDLRYAKIVADFLGTKHTEIVVCEEDFYAAIPQVIKSIESFDTTSVRASVGNYLVAKYIAQHSDAKVLFNGDGSDEVCGGYMYFHYAPNEYEFDLECKRLLNEIHYFDVLRSDRCISSNGLEARTPFLDKAFVSMYLSIPASIRCHKTNNQNEKYLLRSAFSNMGLLPDEVLWRTKEAFSDGISSKDKSWYQIIQSRVKNDISDKVLLCERIKYKYCRPDTAEQLYYREIYEKEFHTVKDLNTECIPHFWMPRFVDATDSSARTLDIYKKVNSK